MLVGLLLLGAAADTAQAARRHGRASNHSTVTAKAAILIDNQTGEILWQRNPDLPLPPASTTKVVTAMLALQSGRLDDSLTVTPEAAQAPPSKISLRPGWRMRLRDLVYAVLLNSANDASVVIAEGLSGSVGDFADRMNAEALLLGATNTHFVNPNGLPAANHYSTARDLATMFSHALRNPLFERVVNTKTTTVVPTFGSRRLITLRTHNRLLGNYHIHVVGKTGWTIAAKKCFVGAATADGRELTVAVMGSNDLWGDLKRLLEFGFSGTNPPTPDADLVEITARHESSTAVGDDDADDARPAKYAIRLATFSQLQTANVLKRSVTRKGYPARIEKIAHGRRRLYRVVVGNYASRGAAEKAAGDIKRTHQQLETLVVSTS